MGHVPVIGKTYGVQALNQRRRETQDQLKKMESLLGRQSWNDLADLCHKEHPQYEDDQDINMDLGVAMEDDDDDTWEDVADPEEESLVYVICDILGTHATTTKRKDARTWKQHLENQDTAWRNTIPQIIRKTVQWTLRRHRSTVMLDGRALSAVPYVGNFRGPSRHPDDLRIRMQLLAGHCLTARLRYVISTPKLPAEHCQEEAEDGRLTAVPPDAWWVVVAATAAMVEMRAAERMECCREAFAADILPAVVLEAICVMAGGHKEWNAHPARIFRPGPNRGSRFRWVPGDKSTLPVARNLIQDSGAIPMLEVIQAFFQHRSIHKATVLPVLSNQVPYRRHYRTAISDAFDIYLIILRDVLQQIMNVLGCGTSDWRAQNACLACNYHSSGREVADTCEFEDHDYFLTRAFVNSFTHKVKARQQPRKPELRTDERESDARTDHDSNDGYPDNNEGDPTDSAPINGSCASHWKAAAADEKKRMWPIYDETGIFASACQHGLILAKYAIAMAAKSCRTLPGKNMHGYDIGCEFSGTLHHSSVGTEFFKTGSRFCVNTFHGYSHSYDCQVNHHSNCISGMGLEDLETMERIFSSSNQLAPVTCYASPHHRHALITLFFDHWDQERYTSISEMLYINYRQALEIISKKTLALQEALEVLEILAESLEVYEREERDYFVNLKDEDPADLREIVYVKALQKYWDAQQVLMYLELSGSVLTTMSTREELKNISHQYYSRLARAAEWSTANQDGSVPLVFLTPHSGPTDYNQALSVTWKPKTSQRVLEEKVECLGADIITIEGALGFKWRWQCMDAGFQHALDYMATRKYHQALGKLQRLVVQRLFELHKLNIAQTGYKAQTHIAKSLQRRCAALHNAVKSYNEAALALNPPRETLDWTTTSNYSFLEEFALLQDTHKDIRDKLWAKLAHVRRAHEEIKNANCEACHMHTSICDEEILFRTVLEDLKKQGAHHLYGTVAEFWRHRRAANACNMAYLEAIYSLPGFSGNPKPGNRKGASLPALPYQAHLDDLAGDETAAIQQGESIEG
ncbi:hypothetical protein C8Q74DRAFT_1222752 [Fomes fomentarius]|nr:hypothetical protein C8Q74DRAFT_1222752 [Fomes fomentarius]